MLATLRHITCRFASVSCGSTRKTLLSGLTFTGNHSGPAEHLRDADNWLNQRVSLLSGRLNCQEAEIRMAIQKYPRLLSIRDNKLLDIMQLLQAEKITKAEILTYPDIFTHSPKSLRTRIAELKAIGVSRIKLISLRESSRIYVQKVKRIVRDRDQEVPYQTKEQLIADHLGCDQQDAEELIIKHKLTSTKLSTLKAKLDLLTKYSCPSGLLMEKLWMLRFPHEVLEIRLRIMEASGLNFSNCASFAHLLTCEESVFAARLEQHRVDREILGDCRDKSEYLIRRLQCSESNLVEMCRRNHKLLSINLPKLKGHLDYFLEEIALPSTDLTQSPRVFNFALETIRLRYAELKECCVDVTINMLSLEKRSYVRLVNHMKTSQKYLFR